MRFALNFVFALIKIHSKNALEDFFVQFIEKGLLSTALKRIVDKIGAIQSSNIDKKVQ